MGTGLIPEYVDPITNTQRRYDAGHGGLGTTPDTTKYK